MDKERILAARKILKEFQKKQKEQMQKNARPDLHNDDEKSGGTASPETHQDAYQYFQQHSEITENNGIAGLDIRHVNKSPNLFQNPEYVNNITTSSLSQETPSIQTVHLDHESTNGIVEIPSYNSFTSEHNQTENNSTISAQNLFENVEHANYFHNIPTQQFDYSNSEFNVPNSNITNSLQKEHLLQMANAVANVLVDDKGLDESALNNCDLEQRNQFLSSCLEEQKKVVNELHIQVSQCTSRISELEAIIATKDAEFEGRLVRELNPLKEQVQLDAQTIGILVGEKAELTATNSQSQSTIKQKTEEVIELSGKLKTSQQQVTDLERELTSFKINMEEFSKNYQELQRNYEEIVENSAKIKKEYEDLELETSELRQKLNYKNTELSSLQQELQEKIALLSLSELRIQQLTNSPHEMNSLESQHHTTKVLERQLSQMKEALESVSGEKDEVSKKYQSYVQQLDERHSKLVTELETSKKIIVESEIREQSYIQRLSELEQQLQKEKAKTVKPVEDQSEKIEILTKGMDNMVLEQENLQSLLNERDNEIDSLKKELSELQNIREQSLEAKTLATALQSEQLGASRAISQNQQLKTQLDEMHDAFIALSNTKLDLTEQLQAERCIGKKLNMQLNEIEQQLEELKEQLAKKEATLAELEKEKLHAAQIEDQIQHYQAQSHSASTLQQELQKSLATIETLKKENQLLQSKLDAVLYSSSTNNEETSSKTTPVDNSIGINSLNTEEKIENIIIENNNSEKQLSTDVNSEKQFVTEDILDKQSNTEDNLEKQSVILPESSSVPSIPEPIKKLESRFKETMERVAELTDEKQRLEHLVLQLQGETETIGEYVTLYQHQRSILQEKAKEREVAFRQLIEQRNQQQEQLHKLKVLVADLLTSKNYSGTITTATAAEENLQCTDNTGEVVSNNVEVIDGYVNKLEEMSQQTDKTKSQILDLLTEIKDCNDSCILEPNFHPCPWCSGKLITV